VVEDPDQHQFVTPERFGTSYGIALNGADRFKDIP